MRAALTAAVFMFVWPGVVSAQLACDARDKVLAQLEKKHGESVTSWGITNRGLLAEILSAEDGSWTMIVSRPIAGGGIMACVVNHGQAWRLVTPPVESLETGE